MANTTDAVDFHAYPEIAAAVLSYVNSPNAREGMYIYLDIGGGTLDGVSFRYRNDEGEKKIDFYTAEIEPNGIEAICNRHRDIDLEMLLRFLRTLEGPDDIDKKISKDKEYIGNQIGKIALETKRKDRVKFRSMPHLPMILGGGGSTFRLFKKYIPLA